MYCSALNESGMMTNSGAIRKKKTAVQIII